MSELTVGQLIKITVGIFVVLIVIAGIYFIFNENFKEFFNLLPENASVGGFWRFFYGN